MNSTRKIGLLLALVFLLPALFFSVYELSSLDKDEKMIQSIYAKQLEAILFSVNQYSDDVLGNWVSRIEAGLSSTGENDTIPRQIKDLLLLNSSIQAVFMVDTVAWQPELKTYSLLKKADNPVWTELRTSLAENDTIIKQLLRYQRSGFRKIQRLPMNRNETQCLIFITQLAPRTYRPVGIFLDARLFIEDIVGPRLQAIASDQFILSAVIKQTDMVVYSTVTSNDATPEVQPAEAVTKEFWLFPEYAIGIRTRGETLQQVVRERTRTNLLLLGALDVILIIAVVLVFRNLKKEVDLAQNKADFVSNVSHEIRTPLALISMFAETLEMDRVPTEEKKREYYRIISKETQRLTNIVNKILNFSQSEAQKKTLHIESLNVDQELKNILETYHFHLSNKGFTYTLTSPESLWIKADRESLIESVINLIDNAVKYSDGDKRLEISGGQVGDFGYIAVKDYGVGISAHDQKHIFDKFYRVPKGNLARSRGTGLGLSLVKQLMESQKGKITVTSDLKMGSTFKLFFPLDKSTQNS
jgi:two-component system, OmpR family, phosphate regulon sensor histidine kinase PhoR